MLSDLPLHFLLDVGKQSPQIWRALMLSVPRVGRWSLDKDYQKYIQRYFTVCIEYNPPKNGYITREYRLYGKLHNLDGPAVECVDGSKWW